MLIEPLARQLNRGSRSSIRSRCKASSKVCKAAAVVVAVPAVKVEAVDVAAGVVEAADVRRAAKMLAHSHNLSAADLKLRRCQVDVAFPPGFKSGSQPHCWWYRDFNGAPQIIEVLDTGWETYHFCSIEDAEQFAAATQARIAAGTFAGGRLPPGSSVTIQQRATLELARDLVVQSP
jgi:hypothetical protein